MRTILLACGLALVATALVTDPATAAESFLAKLARADPSVSADARGQARFELSSDGREMRYEVTVENAESITQGHIHLEPDALTQEGLPTRFSESSQRRQHGRIVAFLMNFTREGVTVDGVLTKGVIRESDLVGPLRGQPLSRLVEFMTKGDTYVALHILKPVPPDHVFCCPVGLRGAIRSGR